MGLQAITWAFNTTVKSPGAKIVLLALANRADDEDGTCWPGQDYLARMTDLTARSVRTHLAFLEKQGFIKRERRRRENGTRTSDWTTLVGFVDWRKRLPVDPELPENPGQATGKNTSELPENFSGDSSVDTSVDSPVSESSDLTAERPPPMTLAKQMVEIWTQELGYHLAVPRKLHDTRIRNLNKRLHEDFNDDLEQWRACCKRIAETPFLLGSSHRGWKANLDWVLKPVNLAKILEGNYDRSPPNGGPGPAGHPDQVRGRRAGMARALADELDGSEPETAGRHDAGHPRASVPGDDDLFGTGYREGVSRGAG